MTGTFEGVGSLQFSPDNKFAYAYSGIIGVVGSEITLLLMETNSEYILSELQILQGTTSNEDFKYKVFFNNVIVAQWHCLQVTDKEINIPNAYFLTIPPFTIVKVTAENTSSGTSREHSVTLTGKVHGAIEQQNLESITDDNKWASL